MTFFYVRRRMPAAPNPNAQPKPSYLDDILKAWDAAQAKADAEEAAEAELHRAIDARKRGSDRLSTIEAAYDVLAERDSRATATQGPTPPAPQPGAAPRPDAGAFREGAVTPASQQFPSMAAGTGGIDDILTLGPFALLAPAYRGSLAGGAIDGSSATPWTAYVDRSPPQAPLAHDNRAISPAGVIERASFEPQSPGPAQPPRTAEDVQSMGPPPADRGYGDRPTFNPCGAEADAEWMANRELYRVREELAQIPDKIDRLKGEIAQIEATGPLAQLPRLSPPKRNDPSWKWQLNAADNAGKIRKYEKEKREAEDAKRAKIEPRRREIVELTRQLESARGRLRSVEEEAVYRAHLSKRCNDLRGER